MPYPPPGTLEPAKDDVDLAQDILDLCRVIARRNLSRTVVRGVIDLWWAPARVPPVVTAKRNGKNYRSSAWPHSPAAIAETAAAVAEGRKPVGLVREHIIPVAFLVAELVRDAELLDATKMVERLYAGNLFAVVTVDENAALNAAGLEWKMPKDWQPGGEVWARYVEACIDPTGFTPLSSELAERAAALGNRRRPRRPPGSAIADAEPET